MSRPGTRCLSRSGAAGPTRIRSWKTCQRRSPSQAIVCRSRSGRRRRQVVDAVPVRAADAQPGFRAGHGLPRVIASKRSPRPPRPAARNPSGSGAVMTDRSSHCRAVAPSHGAHRCGRAGQAPRRGAVSRLRPARAGPGRATASPPGARRSRAVTEQTRRMPDQRAEAARRQVLRRSSAIDPSGALSGAPGFRGGGCPVAARTGPGWPPRRVHRHVRQLGEGDSSAPDVSIAAEQDAQLGVHGDLDAVIGPFGGTGSEHITARRGRDRDRVAAADGHRPQHLPG